MRIDAVRAEIEAIKAAVAFTQRQTSAADHVTQQIALQAAASGFTGIAHNMARVRDIIGQIRAGVGSLSTLADDAAMVVAAAPQQPTPQEMITTIGLLDRKLGDIHAGVGACIAHIDQARQLTGEVLRGGDPGSLLARLDAVNQALLAVTQRGVTARQRAQTAISEARTTGGAGIPGAGVPDKGSPSPGTGPRQAMQELPSWLAQAALDLPKRQPKDPTSGVALIAGERIPMRSGRDPDAAADLKPAYRLIATTTDHLEAKLAARMRRDHITDATVLTNNPPCEYQPYGCERILPQLLPAGSRLTVYVSDDDGQVRHWRTYVGNGKAIA